MEMWTKSSAFLCVALLGLLGASASKSDARLDVFSKLSDGKNADLSKTLSVQGLQRFMDGVTKNLKCEEQVNDKQDGHGGECQKFMCIDASALVSTTLSLDPQDINEGHFEDVCVILLDLITSVDKHKLCHKVIDVSTLAVERSRRSLLNSTLGVGDGDSNIYESSVTKLLDILKEHNSHDQVDLDKQDAMVWDDSDDDQYHGDQDHDLAEETAAGKVSC
ncbi:hypothetical protein ElyMa_005034200 [Elysia marginata]|uniref:Uncharacterized protein n=1 Tax=Elysia marginata TaxID=1093978 RepID=A0AAV4JB30_9GAST|nr:hypothetical protein ElyMa_005034200 [Elysia marginata]